MATVEPRLSREEIARLGQDPFERFVRPNLPAGESWK